MVLSYVGAALRNGVEYLSYAVPKVVAHEKFYEEERYKYADGRRNEKHQVVVVVRKGIEHEVFDKLDEVFEYHRRKSTTDAYNETNNYNKIALTDMVGIPTTKCARSLDNVLFYPFNRPLYQSIKSFSNRFHNARIYLLRRA